MDKKGSICGILHRRVYSAIQGWQIWRKILKKYRPTNSVVMLFPSTDHRCNYHALLYLEQLLEQTGSNSAVLVSVDPNVIAVAHVFSQNVKGSMQISREQAEKLLCYYNMDFFDRRMVVCSLNEPYSRCADKLIGVNGTTVGEIMVLGVFGLSKYTKESVPVYRGNDPIILNFLNTKEFHGNES